MADKWEAEQGHHWPLSGPGWCHTLHPTNISQRWKMPRAARLTPVLRYLQLIAQCFTVNNPSLSTCCRWISAERGPGQLGQKREMPCIARGPEEASLQSSPVFITPLIPWMLRTEQLSANQGQQSKTSGCVVTDRQLSLQLIEHQETANKPQLPQLAPACLHAVYKDRVRYSKSLNKPRLSSCAP